MISILFQSIIDNNNTRQSLSSLRQELKQDDSTKDTIRELAISHFETLLTLLSSKDAKTRRNVALLMGDLKIDDFASSLFQQYTKEETLFVKSAYLTALTALNCDEFIPQLKTRLQELQAFPITPETKKHLDEEMRVLTQLLLQKEGMTPHTFCGYTNFYNCILLTNRLHASVTEEQILHGQSTAFSAGLMVKTDNIQELLEIRTYRELLFVIPEFTTCSNDPNTASEELANSNLLSFLQQSHKEGTPFYFRIDLKCQMSLAQKSVFTKKLSTQLEHLTNRQLINSTSHYELEIRMIENKQHTFNVLVKLKTLPDTRFAYRKGVISSSIRPDVAALLVSLAKEYMVPDAQILDPFCGVGTMLIERQQQIKGNTSYGVDISKEAITIARENTEHANQIIHFINRDFFRFTHEYLFDEIFTNMPFFMYDARQAELFELYRRFFEKSKEVLKPHGTLILYSHNPNYIEELCTQYGYRILENIVILDIEGSSLVILKRQGV